MDKKDSDLSVVTPAPPPNHHTVRTDRDIYKKMNAEINGVNVVLGQINEDVSALGPKLSDYIRDQITQLNEVVGADNILTQIVASQDWTDPSHYKAKSAAGFDARLQTFKEMSGGIRVAIDALGKTIKIPDMRVSPDSGVVLSSIPSTSAASNVLPLESNEKEENNEVEPILDATDQNIVHDIAPKVAELRSKQQLSEQEIKALSEQEETLLQQYRDISCSITVVQEKISALIPNKIESKAQKLEHARENRALVEDRTKLMQKSQDIISRTNELVERRQELEDDLVEIEAKISSLEEYTFAKEAYEVAHLTYMKLAKETIALYAQQKSEIEAKRVHTEIELQQNKSIELMQIELNMAEAQNLHNSQFTTAILQLKQGLVSVDTNEKLSLLIVAKQEVFHELQLDHDNAIIEAEKNVIDLLEKLKDDIAQAHVLNAQQFSKGMSDIWCPVEDALAPLKGAAAAVGEDVVELKSYGFASEAEASVSNYFAADEFGALVEINDVNVDLAGVQDYVPN